jgi:putative serine protease PepD
MTDHPPESPEPDEQGNAPEPAPKEAAAPEWGQQPPGQAATVPPFPHPLPGPYHDVPPMTTVPHRVAPGPSGRLLAIVVALVVLTGLVSGGVGGYVGYWLGYRSNSFSPSALDQPLPARSTSTGPPGSVTQVAQKVLPSVVQFQVQTMRGATEGSGIVLSRDGYLLTNNHVVQDSAPGRISVQFHDGRTARATVVGADPNSDLAVVKADIDGLIPAELGRSDDLPVGAPVVAIGSPYGLAETVTSGIISAKDRPVRAGGENGSQASVLNALQTDAAINPGNSGGPLVDTDGRVVGVNSAIYSPGSGLDQAGSVGLGFAIPINQARRVASELKNTGSATDATLGVRVTNAPVPGALVSQVVPGGAAQRAGVRAGELITQVDRRKISDPDALVAAIRSHAPGDRVTVTLTTPNGAAERTTPVTLGAQKS